MYLGMKRLGRETQLVVYPDEYISKDLHFKKRPYGAVFIKKKISMSLIP
jgi:hypothetical protein